MQERVYAESIEIERSPAEVYTLVSDVTRMGGWSPICKACWWDEEPALARVGAIFSGRNESGDRVWETKSRVVTADAGREFAFAVAGGWVLWSYQMEPVPGDPARTTLTEAWHFTEQGIAGFHEHFGADAQARIDARTEEAHSSIPRTLAAIKRSAEAA